MPPKATRRRCALIAGHYFGGVGQIILAVTITFACLKTSIGLVTSCSETFVKMTHGKLSYKAWAILFTLFSFAVSNVGLSAIIEYSIPVLMLIYPPAIALIHQPHFRRSRYAGCVRGPRCCPADGH